MKKLFASFFLLIFSLQVLPVEQVGKILYKGLMTEEVKESGYSCDDTTDSSNLKKDGDPDPYRSPETAYYGHNRLVLNSLQDNINTNQLPKQYIPDIPTPPPNLVA